MSMRRFVAVTCGVVSGLMAIASGAIAQVEVTNEAPVPLETIPEAFDNGITYSSQDAFSTTFTIGRQIDFLTGLTGFPEVEINRDAAIVHSMYVDVLRQQYSNGPILRTPDLTNPYNSSLRTEPSFSNANQPLPGGEFWLNPIR
jgi:hypothetical protein